MKNRNIYIDIIVNNSMKAIKNLGYTAAFAASMLFPKYSMANDVMSEPKSASKLELALEDSPIEFSSNNYYSSSQKKDKVINKAFALGWEDKNGNKKAEMSEIEDYRGEKEAVYDVNEKPCYVVRMDGPIVPYSVKKDGKKIDKGFVKKKNNSAVKIDLPNNGPGEYTVSFGVLNVKYKIAAK